MPSSKHIPLAILALLVLGATHASTAAADFTPANTAITSTSRDAILTYSGVPLRCTTASMRATTPARGVSALSANVDLGVGGSCGAAGIPTTVTCAAGTTTTLRLTGFQAPSGSGTIALDRAFNCTIDIPRNACRISIVGSQTNVGSWAFTNGTQILNITANAVAATDTGGACSGNTRAGTSAGTAAFSARYTPNIRLTVN